jgi:hypothetical protein
VARAVIDLNEEVANGGGTFAPLPAAWYHVEIEDVEAREVKAGKNAGKEMYNYKLKVVGGDFDGRKLFVNACLWPEAIFTQRDIQAALGLYKRGETKFEVADEDELIGKELVVQVVLKDKYVKPGEVAEKDEQGNLVQDNEVKKFKAVGGSAPAAKKSGAKKAGGFDL